MARYENLPIYKRAMDLAVLLENAVHGFPRYHKYAIGADLRHLARRLLALVITANSRADKVLALTALRDASEEMKTLIVLGKEIKAFHSFKQFELAAPAATEISRQSEGWLKSQRGVRPESRVPRAPGSVPTITVRPPRPA